MPASASCRNADPATATAATTYLDKDPDVDADPNVDADPAASSPQQQQQL